MSLEKDTSEIKKLFETDPDIYFSPFKPATPDNLAKRKEERDLAMAARRQSGEDMCPHCKADLRVEGVYSQEKEIKTTSIEWRDDKQVWEYGDTDYGDGQSTDFDGYYCGKCGNILQHETDFDLESML